MRPLFVVEICRRSMLSLICGAGLAAQERKVFLDYTQQELDAAYTQARFAANIRQVQQRYALNSDAARSKLGAPSRYTYGASAVEQLDVFLGAAARRPAPICLFVHGGAWRSDIAKDFAFLAEPFVAAGAHFIIPDFAHVQDVGGDLRELAAQVRRAIIWVFRNAPTLNGDSNRIYVVGHSSGAHLAATAIAANWTQLYSLPRDIIKAGLLVSGMYDLRAPRLSYRSSYVKFDDEVEAELSPQRHIEDIRARLVVSFGSLESPEFQRQSRDFVSKLRAAGKSVEEIVAAQYNHFEILETLANPHGILGAAALRLFGLSAAR